MPKGHPIKDGERYPTSLDAHAALYRACCQMCVGKALRNMAIQGYYITNDAEGYIDPDEWTVGKPIKTNPCREVLPRFLEGK